MRHSFIRCTRRPVTLLEVLISIALTVIILTTLTFFYRQVGIIGVEADRVIADNFQMRYLETRLAKILPKIVGVKDEKADFVFFSVEDDGLAKHGSQSLIFTYDNGINLDKDFSNHVLGRIYLDKDDNLMLVYWPSPKRWEAGTIPPYKREVLMQGVEGVRFEFYIPPDKTGKKTPEEGEANQENPTPKPTTNRKKASAEGKPTPEPKGDWRRQVWLKEYESLPAMIKMIVAVSKESKSIEYAFPVANSTEHVIYD